MGRQNRLLSHSCNAIVADYGAPSGEEDCLSGTHRSDTIFFAGCTAKTTTLAKAQSNPVMSRKLAQVMLALQARSYHKSTISP